MALVRGKFVDKTEPIKSLQDPVAGEDLARKSYVDSVAAAEAAAAANAKVEDAIVNGVTAKAPSQNAVFDALALKQASLGTGTTSQYLRGDLTWQTVSTAPEVEFHANLAAFPATGADSVIYAAKDTNKIYRYAETVVPANPDWVVGATGDFATLEAALASPSVVNGDWIQVQAGTYSVSSAITISKQVKIYGAGIGSTIFQTAGGSGDPVNVMIVTADNVLLKGMTIKHRKSTNSSVEAAVVVSAGAFPTFSYPANFIMDTCRIEYLEFGLVIRGNAFKLANNQFAYATGTISNSNRCIGIYGEQGNCFIVDNVFDNSALNSTAFRPIYSTSTNNTSNELCSGKLVIEGNTHLGLLQQFYNQDNIRGSAGDFALYLKNNTTNETSLFAGLFVTTANQLDLFSEVVLEGNSISNNHDASTGLGKGMLAIDGTGSGISPRAAALPVHATGNTLAQLLFRADYLEATGSSGSLVGYKPSVFSGMSVALDSSIPSFPAEPATPSLDPVVSGEYQELSPSAVSSVNGASGAVVLDTDDIAESATPTNKWFTDARAKAAVVDNSISDGVTDKAPSQNAVFDALALKLDQSARGVANGVASLGADGKIPNTQVPAIAISDTFVVASEAAMLALSSAEKGDVAVRTDLNKSFILAGTDPAVLADWQELLTPTDAVQSVNGQTGTVTLDSDDIAEGASNKYFSDSLAKAAAVADSITNGVTDVAPSQNAVYDALALKSDVGHTHVAADITDFAAEAKSAAVVNSTAGTETDQAASVAALKSYVSAEISAIVMPVGKKERFVLSAGDITNGYVDCAFTAMADTMMVSTGGVLHNEGVGEDYTLSVVGGKTRITFEPDLAAMLVVGDDIYVQYLK